MQSLGNCFEPASDGLCYDYLGVVNDPDSIISGELRLSLNILFGATKTANAAKIGGDNIKLIIDSYLNRAIKQHTGTTYTFTELIEANSTHEFSNAAAITLTIPNSSDTKVNYDLGAVISCIQTGAGQVTISGASGVTVQFPTGKTKSSG